MTDGMTEARRGQREDEQELSARLAVSELEREIPNAVGQLEPRFFLTNEERKAILNHLPESTSEHVKKLLKRPFASRENLDRQIRSHNIRNQLLEHLPPNENLPPIEDPKSVDLIEDRMAREFYEKNNTETLTTEQREEVLKMRDKGRDKLLLQERKAKRQAELASKGHKSRNKGGAVKNDAMKPRMSLIPQLSLLEVAKVMTYGAEKYAAWNWSEGSDYSVLVDAAQRHITAFNCGEDEDPESGCSHLGHAICCLMMLYDVTQMHPDRDDRWEGWLEEHGREALKKAQKPYEPSNYLTELLSKTKKTETPNE